MNSLSTHLLSPKRIVRGEKAWDNSKNLIPLICKNPLLLGRSKGTFRIREHLYTGLQQVGVSSTFTELKYGCCELDLQRINEIASKNNCDGVIAAGGGKVLDAGKLLANRLSLPCITIPLSAATCAGWTALSNIYSPNGAFQRDEILDNCPSLLIFDHKFIRQAPARTLASGIADALAKWYEASLSSSSSNDGLVQQAVQMARVLRDQLLIDGFEAFEDAKSNSWIRVAEGCGLTAGIIGGLGGSSCRTAIAHALHNGLTQLNSYKDPLHGELVGFGILVQLRLEETLHGNQLARQARLQLLPFLRKLALPINLDSLGLERVNLIDLKEACIFACRNDYGLDSLPFNINASALLEAVIGASEETKTLNLSEPEKRISP